MYIVITIFFYTLCVLSTNCMFTFLNCCNKISLNALDYICSFLLFLFSFIPFFFCTSLLIFFFCCYFNKLLKSHILHACHPTYTTHFAQHPSTTTTTSSSSIAKTTRTTSTTTTTAIHSLCIIYFLRVIIRLSCSVT